MTQTVDEQNADAYKPFPIKDYIEATIPILLNEAIVYIPKSRKVMASWTVAGAAAWLCQIRPATKVVVQSRDEDKAKKLISYARTLYERSDPEWQRRHPLKKNMSAQPDTALAWANDSAMVAITGTPASVRSEHPTITIFDEAAFMEQFDECFNVARGAGPLHMWALSTAEKGPFFDVLENAVPCDWGERPPAGAVGALDQFLSADVKRPVPGLTFGRTDKGWAVIHLHFTADPERRDPQWEILERGTYTSDADFDKEQNINPYAKDGARVYPEFDQRVHVIPHSQIPKRMTRYMAIDPHPRTPHFMLWLGIDQWGDHYYYRELWPSVVYAQPKTLKDTDQENRWKIRDYVEYAAVTLEGNEITWKKQNTPEEYGIHHQRENGRSELIVERYMDQAGKGFDVVGDSITTDSYWDRYSNYGFQCLAPKKQHEAGEDYVHAGLRKRFHDTKGNWPLIHISARCPELILEFKRYRYKMTRRSLFDQELPQVGVESRCHGLDLTRYLETAPLTYIKRLESPEWVKPT